MFVSYPDLSRGVKSVGAFLCDALLKVIMKTGVKVFNVISRNAL